MAFTASDWGRGVLLTGLTPSATLSGYVALISLDNIPTEAIDAGANSAINGGGDLRFSTDIDGLNQLPLEVVSYTTNASAPSRSCQLWVRFPTYASGAREVYMYYKKAAETQPAVGAVFGRNAVWQDYEGVWHLEEDPSGSAPQMLDSTGNANDGTTQGSMISGDLVTGKIGDNLTFDGSSQSVDCGNSNLSPGSGDYTLSLWLKTVVTGSVKVATGNFSGSGDDFWLGIDGNTARLSANGSNVNGAVSINDGSFKYISGGRVGTAAALRVDGAPDGTGTFSGAISPAGPFSIAEFGNIGFNFPGDIDEVRFSKIFNSDDYVSSEYDNQNDPAIFWTTGTPFTPSGGGVTVTATLGTIDYTSQNTNVALTGSIDITTTLGTISYSSQNTTISLTGDIDVTATLGTIGYSSNNTTVIIESGTVVNATLGTIDYTSQNTTVLLSGLVEVTATLGTIVYNSYPVIVQIGEGQVIGNVTAGFADDIYTAGFKPDTITVSFK